MTGHVSVTLHALGLVHREITYRGLPQVTVAYRGWFKWLETETNGVRRQVVGVYTLPLDP